MDDSTSQPQGDMEIAKRELERAALLRSLGHANVAGLLALAGFHFQQEGYQEALKLYQRALREHPTCPAQARPCQPGSSLGVSTCSTSTVAACLAERVLRGVYVLSHGPEDTPPQR